MLLKYLTENRVSVIVVVGPRRHCSYISSIEMDAKAGERKRENERVKRK